MESDKTQKHAFTHSLLYTETITTNIIKTNHEYN